MRNGVVAVRIRRGDMVFHVHGERAGAEGVWLAEGQVQGLYDAPVKTTWKAGAFQVGSRYKGRRRDHRDLVLGFHITETHNTYEFNESAFRQAFQYELDPWDSDHTPTVLEVETTLSGRRSLDVLMFEQPEFEAAVDPLKNQYGNLIMKLRAGQPDWYESDYTATFSSTAGQAAGTILVSNPTDQVAFHRYVLTQANWTLPDPQWVGGPSVRQPGGVNGAREVDGINITAVSGGAVVDWDKSQLAFRDANNTNLQGQIGQRFLIYPIPPHTPPTALPIAYSDAPAGGAAAQLIVPLRWSRPWGMELQTANHYLPSLGVARFVRAGHWEYMIPPEATHLDVVLLGAGGGGTAGTVITGTGGSAGQWTTRTIVRGTDFPAGATTLSGVVGAGGVNGGNGQASTCVTGGAAGTLSAAGGAGGGHTGHVSGDDVFGPDMVFNGNTYTGGGTQREPSAAGRIPGGGGAGGWPILPGGPGARGQVWIRAYKP